MKSAKDCTSIEEIREAIDQLDSQIIEFLGARYQYVKEIVRFKQPTEESIIAKKRYDSVISSRREMAEKNGLSPDLIEKIYKEMLAHFIGEELKLINKK